VFFLRLRRGFISSLNSKVKKILTMLVTNPPKNAA